MFMIPFFNSILFLIVYQNFMKEKTKLNVKFANNYFLSRNSFQLIVLIVQCYIWLEVCCNDLNYLVLILRKLINQQFIIKGKTMIDLVNDKHYQKMPTVTRSSNNTQQSKSTKTCRYIIKRTTQIRNQQNIHDKKDNSNILAQATHQKNESFLKRSIPKIQSFKQTRSEFQLEKDEVEIKETQILAYSQIYISELQKFAPHTDCEKDGKKLIFPSQNMKLALISAYLHSILENKNEKLLVKLKKNIIDCDFDRYKQDHEDIAQFFKRPNQFKAIILKTINLLWSEKSVYLIYMRYEIEAFLVFAFECMILQHNRIIKYQPIANSEILLPFCKFFSLRSTVKNGKKIQLLAQSENENKINLIDNGNKITIQLD